MGKQQNKTVTPSASHLVVIEFRDIADFETIHKVGDDASKFEAKRLAELIEKGLVQKAK